MFLLHRQSLDCVLFIMVLLLTYAVKNNPVFLSSPANSQMTNMIVPAPGSIWFKNEATCEKILTPSQLLKIKECYKKSKILFGRDYLCYDINKQGPCEKGEILVLEGRCGETRCIPDPNLGCPNGFVRFKGGNCTHPLDPLACGVPPRRGFRIRQTAFGEMKCECARHLGFIPVEYKCYHQYLQGPCNDDQQLIRNGDGYICRKNICETRGEFVWRDHNCYPSGESLDNCNDILVEMVKEVASAEEPHDILMEKKEKNVSVEIACASQSDTRSTFITCQKYASDGECLITGEVPQINLDAEEIREAFRKYLDLSDS